ncbi:hypothetical protein N4G62_01740 [Sphingomonas sanguinis]|uniref:Uncharacterized protein n=1 Tax=Sphingomonas sanguinis TaxID=33051 RepID=A0ABU5LLF8_9SPHN|nr:hypothetical protein [Sphingomonas sanguinis]MDZ7280747.1 hypothetical protein [Sphingomonas sanguinis]
MSIDAWHKPFRTDDGLSAVHVDLTFHEGRLGGNDDDMPFTFKMSLKRALLTIRLEHPLRLDRSSVARGSPANEADLNIILSAKQRAENDRTTQGILDASNLAYQIMGDDGEIKQDPNKGRLGVLQTIPRIIVIPRPGGSSEYSWDLQPSYQEQLDGQPWHPNEEPRLHIKGLTKEMRLEPSIKVTLTCSLDDVIISDFQPKKVGIIERMRLIARNEMSEAAAIQYLKLVLRDADIDVGDLDNKHSHMTIADIIAWQD